MKRHVLTFTPAPALDLGGVVDHIKPNEKCYVHDQIKSPGGNGINAARILTRLGIPTLATGFVGGGTGEEIKFLIDKEGVKNKFVPIQGHSRICVTVSNRKDHQQTRLTFPGPHILTDEKNRLFKMIEEDQGLEVLIVGGSLPSGFGFLDARKILKIAKRRNIPCLVDCPGPVLRELIREQPFFIKPNLTEFQEATQSKVASLPSVHRKAQKLLEMIPYICVSSVEGGALLVTREGSYFGRIPKVKVMSTVGAGDSMVGAMAAQFFKKNRNSQDILRWGLAASAATLSHTGTAFGTAREIRTLYEKTKIVML
jgi:1-phosphofructokinase family hexose kinase